MNEIKKDYPEAAKYFEQACEHEPSNSLYLCNYGGVLLKIGKRELALIYFKKAKSFFESQAVKLTNSNKIFIQKQIN